MLRYWPRLIVSRRDFLPHAFALNAAVPFHPLASRLASLLRDPGRSRLRFWCKVGVLDHPQHYLFVRLQHTLARFYYSAGPAVQLSYCYLLTLRPQWWPPETVRMPRSRSRRIVRYTARSTTLGSMITRVPQSSVMRPSYTSWQVLQPKNPAQSSAFCPIPFPAQASLRWQNTVVPSLIPQTQQASPFAASRMALERNGFRFSSSMYRLPAALMVWWLFRVGCHIAHRESANDFMSFFMASSASASVAPFPDA